MKNSKNLIIALLIIIVIIVVGTYTFEKVQSEDSTATSAVNETRTSQLSAQNIHTTATTYSAGNLSDKQITDAALVGMNAGKNGKVDPSINVTVRTFARGDLTGDGISDAVVVLENCGASCGTGIVIVTNKDGVAERVTPETSGLRTNSALPSKTGVKDVSISNGILKVVNENVFNPSQQETAYFKLSGNALVDVTSSYKI